MLRSLKIQALRGKAEVSNQDLFGQAKTGGLRQVTMKIFFFKMGITRPRPDGGVKTG